jgi:ABC-type sugar transport system permease subunit
MTPRYVRAYGLAVSAALIVAAAAFVRYRNQSFEHRELERARVAVSAVATGSTPLGHTVAWGVVAPPEATPRYPFLPRRRLASGRVLGGPSAAPGDKLLYDAAARTEKSGPFIEFADDLVIATARCASGTAVAVSRPPAGPEPVPYLVLIGLVGLGAAIAAAGARRGGNAASAGLVVGAGGLAIPAAVWSGPIAAGLVMSAVVSVAWAEQRGWLDRAGAALVRNRVAYSYMAPAGAAMLLLVAVPFAMGLVLGFYDHHAGTWRFVGLRNFIDILSGGGHSFADPLNFWFTLGVTVAWTGLNVALHVAIGVALALVLRQPWLRLRGVYRTLLIVPWAIPNYITALIWAGMFQREYGAVNLLLGHLGLDKVSWFSSWATAFAANVTTNTWLGFPFMMVVALGALESIPRDMYEAAEVDGARAWQRLRYITLPHLAPALLPAIALGSIWTFNMFNVIYLVSDGRPGGSTDILVTEAYRWAFERGERYGMAAAYATLIFVVLLLWTGFGARLRRGRSE